MSDGPHQPDRTPRDDVDRIDTTQEWDRIAEHWDAQVGDGTDFQKLLVYPATDRLLDAQPDWRVLDACCGNGNYARRLGRVGCRVMAFDGSHEMIERARARTKPGDGAIEYHVADATDEAAVRWLGEGRPFDAAVCSMALMDLVSIDPIFRAIRSMLRPAGAFVFSVGHPAFHTNEAVKWATQVDGEGAASQTFGCLVTRYLSDWAHASRGLLDQPVPHTLFHRSLSTILKSAFEAGFVIDGLEEPAFPPDTRLRSPFSWARRPEIPPVLVVRCRG